MKVICLVLVLGMYAMNSVAQVASDWFGDGIRSASVESGTDERQERVESATATRSPSEFFGTQAAALLRPDVTVQVANEPDLTLSAWDVPAYDFPARVDAQSSSSTDSVSGDDSGAAPKLAVQPVEPPHSDTKIHWKAANGEALLSTGIMHTFNLWTEAGTRDALYGPWAKDWLRSVGELRGWSDSDEFMAPYVGHPIQGSIFGYILRQNDPKYKDVQWGDGRDYFTSLLRSMTFSAVWQNAVENRSGQRGLHWQCDAARFSGVHHPGGHTDTGRADDDRGGRP